MPGVNDEEPISDRLRELLVKQGFQCFPTAWVQTHAVAAPIPANDDGAAKGDAATPPKTAASAAARNPDDKCTRDADYRAKERTEDLRRGVVQCQLRLPRPLHPPLQALAAEAREPGGSRTIVAMAALGLRPEWKQLIYDVQIQTEREALLALLGQIAGDPALRRLVRMLAQRMAEHQAEAAGTGYLIERLLLQPALRKLVFTLIENPQLQNLCTVVASDNQATALVERVIAYPDRLFMEALVASIGQASAGLLGWIATKALTRIVKKQTPSRRRE